MAKTVEKGMPGILYKIIYQDGTTEWLFVDESSGNPGTYQYWTFSPNKTLVDGGEFELDSDLRKDILKEAKAWAAIPKDAIVTKDGEGFSVGELEEWGFKGV